MNEPEPTPVRAPLGDAELEDLVVACLAAADPHAELARRTAGNAEVFLAARTILEQASRLARLEPVGSGDMRDPRSDDRATWPVLPGVELESMIGSGGQGFVFRARQSYLDRTVAVKVLAAQLRTPAFLERFKREARLLAGLQHPHIVACHHAGVTERGECHLVMEFIDGPNLRAWIEAHGRVPLAAAVRMGRDLAAALAHALERGLIHRDVKPENVLLQPAPAVAHDAFPFVAKLADLGLARPLPTAHSGPSLTSPGAIVGTPATMAPEQLDAPERVDHRADIYGLGCVLHHALTGQPAFGGKTMGDLVLQKAARRGDATPGWMPGVPEPVANLVARMLAADPTERPPTYAALITEFAALRPDGATAPRAPRHRWAWLAAGLVGAAVAAWMWPRGPSGSAVAPPSLAVAAPDPIEGGEVVLQAALDGAVATSWTWRQMAGPALEGSALDERAVEGPVWRGRVPHGAAGAELAFEIVAAAGAGLVRREVRCRVTPDPAAEPLAPGTVVALFALSDRGDNVMAKWRCNEPDAWNQDEDGRGVCVDAQAGHLDASLVLPRGGFELRGRIDPRFRYESPTAPKVPIVSTGLRLRFPGGEAAALVVQPSGSLFRATFVRQRVSDAGWTSIGSPHTCEGGWGPRDPLCFSLRWTGTVLEGRVGTATAPGAMLFAVSPGPEWEVPWSPGTLELHAEAGVAVFTDWELVALR